jgi:hypothetical protein
MRRHSRDSAEHEQRQERFLSYLADVRTSDEEKGVITLVMLGHAGVYLLLATTEVTWVALTAARVLRHRGDGLRTAVPDWRAHAHTGRVRGRGHGLCRTPAGHPCQDRPAHRVQVVTALTHVYAP